MKLHIAFSGGETSAFMTKWLLENEAHKYTEVKVVFANTGQENEATLEFINECDIRWGFNTVWVEAFVWSTMSGDSTSHRITDFKSANREGKPFEDVIARYGLPNHTWQLCSRELKTNTVRSYFKRQLKWKRNEYISAIGIRSDEVSRISSNLEKERLIYPLIELLPTTKLDIKVFWAQQSFKLNLKEHEGNCKWCWKKSNRKLLTLAKDTPEIFDFPLRMEATYGRVGAEFRKKGGDSKPNRVIFRGYKSSLDILTEATKRFEPFIDNTYDYLDEDLDTPNSCSESCEPFK